MTTALHTADRTIIRIEDKLHLGPDEQVDDKALLFTPQAPQLTDPFLVLADDLFSSPGFEWHPHRGLETVTLVLDGVLEHGDNIGHTGTLTTGDVQWMTAGRGIIHRELAFRNERAHVLQLWVNLPAEMKMIDTLYQDLHADQFPVIEGDGTRVELISGAAAGLVGPARNQWPITGAMLTLDPNRSLTHSLPARDRAFFTVLSGEVTIAGRRVRPGQTAWSDPASGEGQSRITLRTGDSEEQTVVMTFSGQPIRQPIAMNGPFVMNSAAELDTAFRDFRSGRFGTVPRQARLTTH